MIEQLKRHCSDTKYPAVFALVLKEELWLWVTEGHYILAVKGAPAVIAAASKQGEIDDQVAAYLEAALGSGLDTDVDSLKTWAGRPLWAKEKGCDACGCAAALCTECKGKGEVDCICGECGSEHERTCGTCDGDGAICDKCGEDADIIDEWSFRPGRIAQTLIDRNCLARCLDGLSGKVTVIASSDPESPLFVRGDGFRIMLMPMRDREHPTECPVFGEVQP